MVCAVVAEYVRAVWMGVVLVAFTSICGAALTLFLLKEEWRILGDVRKRIHELPPEVRRKNLRNVMLTWAGMLIAAFLIRESYEWGAHTWSSRTGAAVAIAVFVLIMGGALTAMVVASFREMRQERLEIDRTRHPDTTGRRRKIGRNNT